VSNEVRLKIKIGDDGTLKVVAKEAKKATKATDELGQSTDRVTKSRNKYHKAEKGVGQAGLSSAKSFSKMNQTIGSGSSGLVGAYAVLAANIFALTAAFGALQRAAQVAQLEQGLRSLGTASGIAMQNLAEGLQETTGHALSLADAMRATALASSAGFDSSSIQRLGDVARKASIALGRDTADSLNRLTKGAIKLEPELLDELGIMVRLDEATENYARALGKNANELTTFQKRQAFMNAVLEEGEAKFAAMGDVDTNPFDKLSATFQDLTKTLINILNVGILPVVNFFAGSQAALFGAMIMFGRTIATAMIPALGNLGAKYTEVARASAAASLQQLKSLKNIEGGGANLKKLAQAYDPAIDGQEGLNKMMATARRSLASNEAGLKRLGDELGETSEKYAEKNLKVKASEKALETLTQYQKDFNNTTTEDAKATAVASAAQGNYRQALDELGIAKQKMTTESKKATAGATRFGKVAGFVSLQAAKAAINVKVLGVAFLNMIPLIGQIIAVVGVVISVLGTLMEKFKSEAIKEFEKDLEGIRERADELAESLKEVQKSLSGQESSIKGASAQYTALSNALGTFADDVATLKDSEDGGFFSLFRSEAAGYNEIIDTLATTTPAYKKQLTAMAKEMGLSTHQMRQLKRNGIEGVSMTKEFAKTLLEKFIPQAQRFPDAVKNMATSVKENSAAISDFINAEQVKTSVDEVLASFSDIELSFADLQKNTEDESKKFFESFKEKASDDLVGIIKLDELIAQSRGSGMNASIDFAKLNGLIKEALKTEKETLRTRQKQERLAKITTATAKAEIGLLKQRNLVAGTAVEILQQEQVIRDNEIANLDNQIADVQRLIDLGKDEVDNGEKKKSLERQRAILVEQTNTALKERVADEQQNLKILQDSQKAERAALDVRQKMVDLVKREASARESLAMANLEAQNLGDIRNRGRAEVSAAQKYREIYQKTNKEGDSIASLQRKAVAKEFEIKKDMIDLEYALLKQRLIVLDAEARQLSKERGEETYDDAGLAGLIAGIDPLTVKAKAVLDIEEQASLQAIETARLKALADVKKQFREGGTTDSGVNSSAEAAKVLGDGTPAVSTSGTTTGTGNSDKPSLLDNIGRIKTELSGLMELGGTLGPEGELVNMVAGGALAIADAWGVAAADIKDGVEGMEGAIAIGTAIGQTISQISQIMNAASQARIAGIDKEIDAEKKRDGKSKESLAKIKALEKKKEAMERKAFEQNKKMQIASIITATAVGIMKAYEQGGTLGFFTGAIIAAMGAAQLAIVQGTSFQGGGSAPSAGSDPTKISVGKRRDSVDIAKSQSARGELAYFRGERGMGSGPENFRPAFYGKKNRAMGGSTGYVVGEQGPELFVPDRPGTIVPADETSEMGAGANVTFNINTIDATGVEDLLIAQRGNVIGMIREASNSYGQTFLEDVDTDVYTPQTGGVSRY
tara:strand:- start:5307 stop:9638 length:4332 start_codon:yes stop_codon:yes gene_type:complete